MDIHRLNGAKGNSVCKHEHLMLRYLSRDKQLMKPSATAVLCKAGMLLYFFSFVLIYAGGEGNVHCNEVKMSLLHVASTA